MRFVRPVVKTVGSLTERVRDVNRLRAVSVILAKHGLGILVTGIPLPNFRAEATFESNPQRVVKAIQELGPTFIKFGQILSTRPDIIPPAFIAELETLQDNVDALPFSDVEAVLREDIGENWRDSFDAFSESPLATASIAQVHRARLKNKTEVVLKIQRPGIEKKIRADLNILSFIINF